MSRDYATEMDFPTDQMNGAILIAQYLLQLSIHIFTEAFEGSPKF